jgi:hypothetical protein
MGLLVRVVTLLKKGRPSRGEHPSRASGERLHHRANPEPPTSGER